MLHIILLGSPRFELAGRQIYLGRHKSEALLAYLAVTAQPQHRATLAALFWPEKPSSRALANLRRDLSLIRTKLGAHTLCTNGDLVWLDTGRFRVDVAEFRACLKAVAYDVNPAADALAAAVAAYGGPFMSGFTLLDSPEFDEWQFFLREELAQAFDGLLKQSIERHTKAGNIDAAIDSARRLLAHDPLDEAAHRTLMRLYARQGQWSAAQRQYDTCLRLLADELGVPPAPETVALYVELKAHRLDHGVQPVTVPTTELHPDDHAPTSCIQHLPARVTALIGRSRELAELEQLLLDEAVRLVTVVGPGGVGKTRLALEATAHHAHAFRHGVCYVGLASVTEPNAVASAVARALGLAASSTIPAQQQVIDFLQQRHFLLLLDNFEHLLPAVDLVHQLLSASPQLTILCTSRVRLELQWEHVLLLKGLDIPSPHAPVDAIGRTAAVRLFLQQAHRAQRKFTLTPENAADVVAICQLTQGMPLALFLAAAWTDLLTCDEIARHMAESIDFLTVDLRDLPERHHSLRAVFDSTWALLTPREREIFARLAVFVGGFSVPAAAAVAQANLRDLRGLYHKSLIERTSDGRFEIHELLRQHAGERLAQHTEDTVRAHEAHARFFAHLIATHAPALKGRNQVAAATAIGQDLENVRQAWQWAAAHQRVDLLASMQDGLCLFYDFRGNTQAGIVDCGRVIDMAAAGMLDADALLLAQSLQWLGVFQRERGHFAAADAAWQRSHALLDAMPVDEPAVLRARAVLHLHQGIAAVRLGDYDAAHAHYTGAEAILRVSDARWELGITLLEHATVYWHWNRYAEGRPLCAEALDILHELDDSAGESDALMRMGLLVLGDGHVDDAEAFLRRSVALTGARGADRITLLTVQNILGWVLILAGKYEEAAALSADAMAVADDLGNRYWASMCRWTTALARLHEGEFACARARLTDGLALARAIGYRRGESNIMVLLAWLDLADGDPMSAATRLKAAMPLAEAIGHKDELGQAQASLALAQILTDDMQAARPMLRDALANVTVTGAYLALIVCLPIAACYFSAIHRTDLALRLHSVAQAQPFWHKSQWYAALFGSHIDALIAAIPSTQATDAQEWAKAEVPRSALRIALTELSAG